MFIPQVPRQSEVRNSDAGTIVLGGKQDVLWLEVTVHDPFRMDVLDGFEEDVASVSHHLLVEVRLVMRSKNSRM